MQKTTLILAAGVALVGLPACQGGTPTGPDEYRVVKKAELVIPPEYNLRPPEPGQALPAEVDPGRSAVALVFGASTGQNASASERALVQAAGAAAVNPIIREEVDYQEAKVIRKSSSVTDRVLFWRGTPEEAAEGDNATGGEPVAIERGNERGGIKLPGT